MSKVKEPEKKSSPVTAIVIVILGALLIVGTVWFAVHQDELFPPETEAETEIETEPGAEGADALTVEDAELTEEGAELSEEGAELSEEDAQLAHDTEELLKELGTAEETSETAAAE